MDIYTRNSNMFLDLLATKAVLNSKLSLITFVFVLNSLTTKDLSFPHSVSPKPDSFFGEILSDIGCWKSMSTKPNI